MDIAVVGVLSADPTARTGVEAMWRTVPPIDHASCPRVERAGLLELRCRVAPWCSEPISDDGEQLMVVLGRPWLGRRVLTARTLAPEWRMSEGRVIARLGGSFAVIVWDAGSRTLIMAADRLATKKIYLWQRGTTLIVATGLQALLAHPLVPRMVDECAVEQFLITSHLVDTRTFVRDVRVMAPATITRFSPGGAETTRYWRPAIAPDRDAGTLDDWADRLAGALESAVRSRCDPSSPPLLPLSGGLDSRCIAAFIPRDLTAKLRTYTFGYPACYDVRHGRRVARALGASFERLALPERFFSQYLDPVQTLCDGEVSIEATPMYRLLEAGAPGSTLITGFLGDALSGGHLLGIPDDAPADQAREEIWSRRYRVKGFSEEQLARVLLPDRYKHVRGHTRALMDAALDEAEAETLDERALIVELHHRQSRYISYLARMLSYRHVVECPFLDLDVLDTFLALPLRYRRNQRAYRRILVRSAPHLAAIPENKTLKPVTFADTTGMPPPAEKRSPTICGIPAGVRWRLNMAKRYVAESIAHATDGWLGKRDRHNYVDHAASIRRIDAEWFRSRLASAKACQWFHTPAIQTLFEEHLTRRQDHSIRINNAVALVNWLEKAGL